MQVDYHLIYVVYLLRIIQVYYHFHIPVLRLVSPGCLLNGRISSTVCSLFSLRSLFSQFVCYLKRTVYS